MMKPRHYITMMICGVAVALLTGCQHIKTEPVDITIPANLKVRCPDLDPIEPPVPPGVSMKYITNLQTQYITCATRNDALIDAVTKEKK